MKMKTNVFFLINLTIVLFFSFGAAYFTIIPMILWDTSLDRVVSASTQNYPMIGLWLVYFANIVFLPFTFKRQTMKLKIGYAIFLAGIVIFVVIILNPPFWN